MVLREICEDGRLMGGWWEVDGLSYIRAQWCAFLLPVLNLRPASTEIGTAFNEEIVTTCDTWLFMSLLLVIYFTYDAFSVTRIYGVDYRVISEWQIGKYLVGRCRGLILRSYFDIRLVTRSKTTKTSIRMAFCRGRDLKPGPPEYEAGVLTTRPRCSVVPVCTHSTQWNIITVWSFVSGRKYGLRWTDQWGQKSWKCDAYDIEVETSCDMTGTDTVRGAIKKVRFVYSRHLIALHVLYIFRRNSSGYPEDSMSVAGVWTTDIRKTACQ
jgi:hypothetical protein